MRKFLKNSFIPHKGNKYRPDFLEQLSVGVMLVLILLSFSLANLQALLWVSSDWLVSTILPAVIVDLTNDERGSEKMANLNRNDVLDTAARLKAEDMARHEYFAHYSPDGVSPWYWFDQAGYNYLHAGENLAVHFTESGEVVDAWMNSPSHRANILNGNYTEIGVGTAKGDYKGQSTVFVVQLFGTRRVSDALAEGEVTIEKVAVRDTEDAVLPATISADETIPRDEVTAPTSTVDTDIVHTETLGDRVSTPESVAASPESVVVYSNLATTSREGEPFLGTLENNTPDTVPFPLRTTTESSLWLEIVYAILAVMVVLALGTSMVLEWRRRNLIQTAYAGGLLVVMALLLYIHVSLTGSVIII